MWSLAFSSSACAEEFAFGLWPCLRLAFGTVISGDRARVAVTGRRSDSVVGWSKVYAATRHCHTTANSSVTVITCAHVRAH